MAWTEKVAALLTESVGGIGSLNLFSPIVKEYLQQYDLNTVSDPFFVAEVYTEIMGFRIFENQEFRRQILQSLPESEIEQLAVATGLSSRLGDSREDILQQKWNWNSSFALGFCRYFECEDVIAEAKEFIESQETQERVIQSIESSSDRFFELHAYQSIVRDDVIRHFEISNQQKALIQLPTGAGKTRVGIHTAIKYLLAQKDRKHVLWLAYQPLLLKQALDAFESIWPILGQGPINIGQCYGGISTLFLDNDQSFTFANVSVLLNYYENYKELLESKLCLVIFDEAHQSVADNAKRLLSSLARIDAIKLIGLTATPGRSASDPLENRRLVEFFDNSKFEISPPQNVTFVGSASNKSSEEAQLKSAIRWLQDLGVLARLNHEVIEISKTTKISTTRDEIYTSKLLKEVEKIPERNSKIVEKLIELNEKGMKTLVFACSIEHSQSLVSLLKFRGINAGLVTGENTETRDTVLHNFIHTDDLNILVNFGVLTTGFDAPDLDALLIARPTSSVVTYSQMLGRALRGPLNGGHVLNHVYNVGTPYFGNEVDAYNYFSDYWS